jgi:rubrerythrin
VSRVSETTEELPLICEFCGTVIEDDDQRCPALDDGRCQP